MTMKVWAAALIATAVTCVWAFTRSRPRRIRLRDLGTVSEQWQADFRARSGAE
jgi:hypothetical protein